MCLRWWVSGSGTPAVQERRRSREAHRRLLADVRNELLFAFAHLLAGPFRQALAAAPGQHQEGDRAGEQQRKPAALEQLERIRREEHEIRSAIAFRCEKCSALVTMMSGLARHSSAALIAGA
jgi:hypothetical protein